MSGLASSRQILALASPKLLFGFESASPTIHKPRRNSCWKSVAPGSIVLTYIAEGHELKVTMSIGVSTVTPTDDDRKDMISAADIALYEAKNSS